jgi:hypothetical protein
MTIVSAFLTFENDMSLTSRSEGLVFSLPIMDEHLAFGFFDMDMRGRVVVVIDVEAKSIFVPNLWHTSSLMAFSYAPLCWFCGGA